MNISVIIPTYNNYFRLKKTLFSFKNLIIPYNVKWELLIVDNNSSDFTKRTIEEFINKLPIKYIFEPKQGISYAKNAGLQHAIGKLVIFTDDDVIPCENWLKTYWQEYLLEPNGLFWGGPVISDFEIPPLDMNLISLGPPSVKGLNWGEKKRELNLNEFFLGANWAAPTEVVKNIGGFNIELGLNAIPGKFFAGEETELMERLKNKGLKPTYIPDCSIRHFVPKSKMTIEHIAARAEATGRFSAEWVLSSSSVSIFGVPRWIWKKAITLWLKSKINKILNKNWHNEYISYRRIVGCIKQIKKI
jgi:glycosyltransferase involved in cell wall biosynthesis